MEEQTRQHSTQPVAMKPTCVLQLCIVGVGCRQRGCQRRCRLLPGQFHRLRGRAPFLLLPCRPSKPQCAALQLAYRTCITSPLLS